MKRVLAGIIFGLLVISNSMLYAKKIDDSAALNGVKEIKSVFLIDFTNVKKTAFYLNIIEGTYKGLVNQDVKPKIVLVFIGETVKYLSTKQEESFEMEYEEELNSIKKSVDPAGRDEIIEDIENFNFLPKRWKSKKLTTTQPLDWLKATEM